MSDAMQPHRQQPTRLHRPWDSPGKNTGVGCRFLLQYRKVKSELAQSCPTRPHGLQPTMLLRPWDFPGKSTGVGCHCLLQACDVLQKIYSYYWIWLFNERSCHYLHMVFYFFIFFSYGFLNFLCTKWSFVLNASMHLFKIYYEKRKYSSWSELWSLFLSINLTFETVVKSLHLVLEAHACNFASVAAMLAFFYSDPYACKWKSLSRVQHFVTPWAIQFMEFSRPEYWNG